MRRTRILCLAVAAAAIASTASAQHAAFRITGRVMSDKGGPVPNADVHIEAFYGYGAGTFAGQRIFTTTTDAKGSWSMGAMQPGVWLFAVSAPGYLPETVVLPPRILATVSQGTSGLSLTWTLVLKLEPMRDGERGDVLKTAADAVHDGKADPARSALLTVPIDADADFLAAAGRIAIVAHDPSRAATLFRQALELDPSSYRAALGIASTMLLQRDFDGASKAFDAARSRTHDKDEQRFIAAAIGELQAIKYR
jgi:hypothetical protein